MQLIEQLLLWLVDVTKKFFITLFLFFIKRIENDPFFVFRPFSTIHRHQLLPPTHPLPWEATKTPTRASTKAQISHALFMCAGRRGYSRPTLPATHCHPPPQATSSHHRLHHQVSPNPKSAPWSLNEEYKTLA